MWISLDEKEQKFYNVFIKLLRILKGDCFGENQGENHDWTEITHCRLDDATRNQTTLIDV
jgi:hypothetical protein